GESIRSRSVRSSMASCEITDAAEGAGRGAGATAAPWQPLSAMIRGRAPRIFFTTELNVTPAPDRQPHAGFSPDDHLCAGIGQPGRIGGTLRGKEDYRKGRVLRTGLTVRRASMLHGARCVIRRGRTARRR